MGILILVYVLLVLFYPKGSLIQEAIYMPIYWVKTFLLTPTRTLSSTKYIYGTHKRQYFLCLEPKDKNIDRQNIILYYHGGGWRFGRPELFKANAKVFTDLGFTVIMPSFRPCPKYNYYDIREDIDQTLLKLKEVLRDKNILHKNIILGGMSAGGNLVAHILYNQDRLKELGYSIHQFSGIFLCGAPLDLSKMWYSSVIRDFAGKRNSSQFKAANPVHYLPFNHDIPTLCIHGTKDGMVEYESTQHFIQTLQKKSPTQLEFETIEGGSHLDAGSWVHSDNEIRKMIVNWVLEVEKSK